MAGAKPESVSEAEENSKLLKEFVYLKRLIEDHLTQNQSRNIPNKPKFYGKSHSTFSQGHYRKNAFIPSIQNGHTKNVYKIDRTQACTNVVPNPKFKCTFNSQKCYTQDRNFQKYPSTRTSFHSSSRDNFKLIRDHSSNVQIHSPPLMQVESTLNKEQNFSQNILHPLQSSIIKDKVKCQNHLIKSSLQNKLTSHSTTVGNIISKDQDKIGLVQLPCNEKVSYSPKCAPKSDQCTILPFKTENSGICNGSNLRKHHLESKTNSLYNTALSQSEHRLVNKFVNDNICNTCEQQKQNLSIVPVELSLKDQKVTKDFNSSKTLLKDQLKLNPSVKLNQPYSQSLQSDSSHITSCSSSPNKACVDKKAISEECSSRLPLPKVMRSSCFCDSEECQMLKLPLPSIQIPRVIPDIQFFPISVNVQVSEPKIKSTVPNSNAKSETQSLTKNINYLKPDELNKNVSQLTGHSSLTPYFPSLKLKRKRRSSVCFSKKDPLYGVVRMIKTKYKVVNKKNTSTLPPFSKVLNTRYRIINKKKLNANMISSSNTFAENKTTIVSNVTKLNENNSDLPSKCKTTSEKSKYDPLSTHTPNKILALLENSSKNRNNENKNESKLPPKVNSSHENPLSLSGRYTYIKGSDKNMVSVGKSRLLKKKSPSCLSAKIARNKFSNKILSQTLKNKYKFVKISDGFSPLLGKSKYKFVKKKLPLTSPSVRILKTRRKLINKSAHSLKKQKPITEKSINTVTPKCRGNKNFYQENTVKVLKTKFRVVNSCSSQVNLNKDGSKSFKTKYQLVNQKKTSLLQETLKTRYSFVNCKSLHPLRTVNIKAKKYPLCVSQRKVINNRKSVRNRNEYFTKNKFKLVNVKNTSPSQTLTRLIKNKYKLVNRKVAKFSSPLLQSNRKQRHLWQSKSATRPWIASGAEKLGTSFTKYGRIPYHLGYHRQWRQQMLKKFNTSRRFTKKVSLKKKRQTTKMVIIGGLPYRASKMRLSKASSFKKSPLCGRSSVSLNNKGKTLIICGVRYQMDATGKVLKRIPEEKRSPVAMPKVTRLSLGGETYVQTQPGILTKTNFSQVRTLANRVVHRSIHRVISGHKKKMRKNNTYCMFYNRFGKCNKGDECQFVHDPQKVAVCTRFLRGTCRVVDCPFSHEVSPDKMPVCNYFLQGNCTNKNCPYRHIEIDPQAEVCKEFLKGYCHKGKECVKTHILICPTFAQKGKCDRVQCPWPHPPKRGKKRSSSASHSSVSKKCSLEEFNASNDVASRKDGPLQINKKKGRDLINENCYGSEQSLEVDRERTIHSDEPSERYFNCKSLINEFLTCKTLASSEVTCENSINQKELDSVQDEHYNKPVPKKLTSLPEFIPLELETSEQILTQRKDCSFSNQEVSRLSTISSFISLQMSEDED